MNSTIRRTAKLKKATKSKGTTEKTQYRPRKQINTKILKKKRPVISVQNLLKNYDSFRAVNSISFEVMPGEIFGILGPNGAGKTTTLEIIETLRTKTDGKIIVDGLDIDIYPQQVKQSIGIQLQSGGFYPRLNLLEQVDLFARIYNAKVNAYEILKEVTLEDKRYQGIEMLSSGQRQRFSIALTLIANPKIIFLDEPTTGLDPQARRNIWKTIRNLQKTGKTIVLTTHYMEEAQELCDKVAIMDNGRIVTINTVDNLIKDLLNRGFKKKRSTYEATLEDVFLDLTGKKLRD